MTDITRYSRQWRFSGIGEQGQARVRKARVVIVGCGALGSVQAELLARAGVGSMVLIDRDFVELSNLQRQVLYDETDAADALPKAVAAARRLAKVNSEVAIEPAVADLTAANADDLLSGAAIILDGTDNFETRYLINDYAIKNGIPWIYGGAVGSYGITIPIVGNENPCFRCLYPEPPGGVQPTCETAGVLGPVTAIIASLQTAAALRILCSERPPDQITTIDVWLGDVRQTTLPERDPDCVCCGRREFMHLDSARRAPVSLCGRNAVQIHERARPLDLAMLAEQLGDTATVRQNGFALRATFPDYEMTVFPDGRAIIKGTTDVGIARSLYARYIGA